MFKVLVRLSVIAGAASMVACQGGAAGNPAVPMTHQASVVRPAAIGEKIVNWPQYRFDDNHTGFNPHEKILNKSNAPQLQLLWQGQLGKLVDYSSPAIVNGVAYLASSDGVLWAYSANGCGQSLCSSPMWQSTPIAQIMDSPTVAGGFVYVGSQTSFSSNAGKLDVFSATGCGQSVCPPLWQGVAGTDAILQSSPTVAHGLVYVGAYDGKLYAFKARAAGRAPASRSGPQRPADRSNRRRRSPTACSTSAPTTASFTHFKAKGCGSSSCAPLVDGNARIFGFRIIAGRRQGHRLHRFAARRGGIQSEGLRQVDVRATVASLRQQRLLQRLAGNSERPRLRRRRRRHQRL